MCAAVFSSCSDEYDDTALRNEVEDLKDRVEALEARLTQEVNTLKGLIQAAEQGLAVGVEEVEGGYEVTIGDETFTINHGTNGEAGTPGTVITVQEVEGVYYWVIDGEVTQYPVTGEKGETGPEGPAGDDGDTPYIKDGKWYIGEEEVGPATGEDGDSFFKSVVVNDDDTVTFTLNDEQENTIILALAKSAKYTNIQSIKFVPEYSDGKATVSYYTGANDAFIVAKYEVVPAAAAETIAKYVADASMQAVYTKTRAAEAGDIVELKVSSIEAAEGIITVTANASALAEEFFTDALGVSVRFAVQDDLSGNASGYVPAVATKAEVPALTATAVAEGYQGAKLTWTEIPGAAYYQIKSGETVVAEKVEGVAEYLVENLTDANKYAFTVFAFNAANEELTSDETDEIQIFSLTNRPEPEIRLVDGVLELATDFEWTDNYTGTYTEFGNLHEYGILIAAEVYFYKDGATEPTYTAIANCDHQTATSAKDYHAAFFTHHYAKGSNCFTVLKEWKWNGATEDSATAPEMEPGTYTVKYKAYYAPITGGKYNNKKNDGTSDPDRIHYTGVLISGSEGNNIDNMIAGSIAREADSDLTFTVEAPVIALNAKADIDEGTVLGRTLWGNSDSWYNGIASVNGLFESVKLSWDVVEADKIVIAYGDQTVEVEGTATEKVIEGLKTSPVEFTISAVKGSETLVEEKVTSDVYVLPTADTNAQWVAKYTEAGYQILGTGWNTMQYTTAHVTFNIYEKGSTTAVFDKDVNYKGSLSSIIAWTMGDKAPNGVCYAGPGNRACHGGDGHNWDEDNLPTGATSVDGKEVFTGLDPKKEYVVKYTLKVWPYIFDATHTQNVELYTNDKGEKLFNYFFKKMLVSGSADTYYNAIDLKGEADLTFEGVPEEPETPAIDWDYVCGAYAISQWSSPYWNTDAKQRYAQLGYGYWYNYVKLASNCNSAADTPCGTPKDGQRYGLVYSWNNHAFFDISSTEIDPQTWEAKAGTGCYALINMIDRETDYDKITNNYSYYDKNEEAFYISFTLTSGGTVYRHDGKMSSRGTVDIKEP